MVTNSRFNYRAEIIKMVSKMNNNKLLETLYGFVVAFYQREKSAK